MLTHVRAEIAWFGSTVTPAERRLAGWLGWVSIFVMVGLTLTGTWQFITHEPDPDWFRYTSDTNSGFSGRPSTGVAELHGLFGDAAFIAALFGGAWFAYKILFRVPKFALLATAVTLVTNISGSVIRFNAVKIDGRALDQAENGYSQLFTTNVDFVVNGRQELGETAIRLITLTHVLSVPVLLIAAWSTLARSRRTRQRNQAATDPSLA